MRKLCRVLFSRYAVSALIILAELALLFYLMTFAYVYSALAFSLIMIVDILAAVGIISMDANPEYKVSWLFFVLLIPLFGSALFLMFYSRRLSKKSSAFMKEVQSKIDEAAGERDGVKSDFLSLKGEDGLAAGKAHAILAADALSSVYRSSESRYFESGESMYESMVSDIERAKKYIFLEYFLIEDGKMWSKIHSLLREKAKSGVEVRVLYDDIGCMKTLPARYPAVLNKEGIKCHRFAPVSPRITISHNNRDHRKILIIDGKIAYTGGINIADEYINEKLRFGHWKDGGIRIFGRAARGFLKHFLFMWSVTEGKISDYSEYFMGDGEDLVCDGGYYIPYATGPIPIYSAPIAKQTLINIVNQAESYVYITTPYLIMDYDLTEAMRNAAIRGVKVKIITPGIADKRLVKLMTKSSYSYLVSKGVEIYEYTKGFIHEKTVVSDDKYLTVGTINLDYRSFAHHYENGVWIYSSKTIFEAKEKIESVFKECKEITEKDARLGLMERIVRNLLRLFAPIM